MIRLQTTMRGLAREGGKEEAVGGELLSGHTSVYAQRSTKTCIRV